MIKVKNTLCLLGLSLVMFGCAAPAQQPIQYYAESPIEAYAKLPQHVLTVRHGALAAQALVNKSKGGINKEVPLIIASFVDSDDLKYTTGFGRMLTQQFSTQFVNNGYMVVELLLRDNILVTEKGGEFMLSREVKDLSLKHESQAAVVGTYVVGSDTIYVTAKIVDIASDVIISSLDFDMPLDSNAKQMLENSAFAQMPKNNPETKRLKQ